MPGIYAIVNSVNGKAYIGSTTTSFPKRWSAHRSQLRRNKHHNPYLRRAWNKYGEASFEFVILEKIDDIDTVIEYEQKWLDHYRKLGQVYNIGTMAQHPFLGHKFSDEHRHKISDALMGIKRPSGSEHHLYGKRLSKEHCLKISLAKRGEKNPMYGRDFSPQHRARLSKAATGRKQSEETKRKLSEINKGKVLSKEHVRKMAESKSRNYPPFYNERTGEIIPAGRNFRKLCRDKGFSRCNLEKVLHGKKRSYKGWILLKEKNLCLAENRINALQLPLPRF